MKTQTLNRSYQTFVKLFMINSSLLFSMTLQRLVLFLVVVRHGSFGAQAGDVAQAFWMGVRFDLCVLGFFNIPVLFWVWLMNSDRLFHSENNVVAGLHKWGLNVYLGTVSLVIHVLAFFDLLFFAFGGHRWTYFDLQVTGFNFVGATMSQWGAMFSGGLVAFFLLLWIFRSVFILIKSKVHMLREDFPIRSFGIEFVRGVVLPLIVVASCARGTWTAHHIRQQDSEVSQIPALNQMALSPVWAFDKRF